MIKVLHVISDKNIGGAGKLLLNIISEIDKNKFELYVILPRNSLLMPLIKKFGIYVKESDMSFFALVKAIRKFSPHILHTHACAKARVAAKFCGVAVTVNTKHCANDSKEEAAFFKRIGLKLFDALFTTHTIATADYVKRRLVLDGIPKRKITVIVNGSLPQKELTAKNKLALRAEYGFTESDFLVGLVARIEAGKGHEYFIEAARICQNINAKIKFLVVGDGAMTKEVKLMAADLKNLIFTGFLPDVGEIMNILDANVNCSYVSETSSLSLSEGMSLGVIPVVSDCGGNSFMAEECGIVVPKKDGAALAESLVALSNNSALVKRLKKNAVYRFWGRFTADYMVKENEKLYLSLLGKIGII